jgi:hypothetical protein
MSLKDNWKKMNTNEKVAVGAFAVLLAVLIAKWDTITKSLVDGFSKLFGANQNN